MPGIGSWIDSPLDMVDNLLIQSGRDSYAEQAKNFFSSNLSRNESITKEVPSLNSCNLQNVRPESLVKFRCMIQDMFGPEYYLDVFETYSSTTNKKSTATGRYRDVLSATDSTEIVHDSSQNKTSERHVFYCVPVPGETEWVKQGHESMCIPPRNPSTSNSTSTKRPLENDEEMETDTPTPAASADASDGNVTELSKRVKTNAEPAADKSTSESLQKLNCPLPGEMGPAVLVKVYSDEAEALKLNDIIEVYGVISTDPSLSTLDTDEDTFSMEEMKSHNPPPSLVPRLHAVVINKLSTVNPTLMLPELQLDQYKASIQKEADEIRENLVSVLEHCLGGDSLAAEYLLCHLISSVYVRKETVAIGKLPLNLTQVPVDKSFTEPLVKLMEHLVTSIFYLPMTLENMNKLVFTPTKNYDENRLRSGILQLPNRCRLVVDETALVPGKLDVNGVKNLTSLGSLIRWQRVSYDFKYHQQDFDVDVPVLALSEGKSLLPCDIVMPLVMRHEIPLESRHSAINTYLTPELTEKIRLYLTIIPTIDCQMDEDMTKMVQEDFVSIRQSDKDSMSIDDFQLLLVLNRLLAISHGLTRPTNHTWEKVKLMEQERKSRLSK